MRRALRPHLLLTTCALVIGSAGLVLALNAVWAQSPDNRMAAQPGQLTQAERDLFAEAAAAAKAGDPSQLLADARYDSLRPHPVFRELIKAISQDHKVTICGEAEPGSRILVRGRMVDATGAPAAGVLAYFYHTNDRGLYAADAAHLEGQGGDPRFARLFGYLTTGENGEFEIRTIWPGGYPDTNLPRHIHLEVRDERFQTLVTEFVFKDDERLTGQIREQATRARFPMADPQNGADGVKTYEYTVTLQKN